MKYIKLFLILTVLVAGVFSTAVSAQTYGSGKISQQDIERKVSKRLLRLPYYGVFDFISFKVVGDTVTLHGKVAQARNKKDAERALNNINGVKQVINRIESLPPSPFDDSIRIRLLKTIARHGGLFRYLQEPNPSIRLVVEGGRVTLEGYVATRGDFDLINILANGVSDVFSVENNLVVEKEPTR